MFYFRKRKQKIFDPIGKVRYEFIFKGTVQNIGFRFEIQQRALHFKCTGWARNNDDGSVTAQLQGMEENIFEIISDINHIDRIHISSLQKKVIPLKEEYDFKIIY